MENWGRGLAATSPNSQILAYVATFQGPQFSVWSVLRAPGEHPLGRAGPRLLHQLAIQGAAARLLHLEATFRRTVGPWRKELGCVSLSESVHWET